MLTTTAYDYKAAIDLMAAHPSAHFTVTADGGIRKESAVAHRFGHRGVEQLQRDAEVGKALIEMFGRQVLIESATAHPKDALSPSGLVNPRHDASVARYIAAYNQRRQQDQAFEANSPDANTYSMLNRMASIPAGSRAPCLDPGSLNLRTVQQALAKQGLSPGEVVSQTEKLVDLARAHTPAQLSAFNRHTMGLGSVTFKALFEDPSLLDAPGLAEPVQVAERAARFQGLAERATDELKQSMLNARDQWIIDRWRQGGSTGGELMEHWITIQQTNAPELEAVPKRFGKLVADAGPEVLQALQAYLLQAKSHGLSAEQAMLGIRLFMGNQAQQTLNQVWQAEPQRAPQLDELRLLARLVDEGVPLTEQQRQDFMQYLPPSST